MKISMWLGLCLLLTSCRAPQATPQMEPYEPYLLMNRESVTVPLTNGSNLQWLVNAVVNGQPGVFILDTGAEFTSITPEFAGKLGLSEPDSSARFTKISSTGQKIQNVPISSFRLGGLEYFNFYAAIINLNHINQALHSQIAGIIGNNLLNQTAYTIDWKRNALTLTTRLIKPPPNAIAISIRTNRVYCPVSVNGRKLEFALDTGSYRCLLSQKEMARLAIEAGKQSVVEAPEIDIEKALNQEHTVVSLDQFKFGFIERRNFPIMIWDHSVLGMDLLQSYILTVDARRNWLLLTKEPSPLVFDR
ncbi:aspartyl protease family protein [Pedosphaera parvula]|uniref:aspartyl protease family protein n=1 Tax=Pedosphaera parvula TaxID=1032527 RepID=UPI00135F11FB|nr:aspartyl protease family protein [Pedosphaera parvula]